MKLIIAKTVLSIFLLAILGILVLAFATAPLEMLLITGVMSAFFLLMWSASVLGEHWDDTEDM